MSHEAGGLTARLARSAPAAWAIATVLGVGHFPFASGTVATMIAVPLWLVMLAYGGPWVVLIVAIGLVAAGVMASGVLESRLGYHDPSEVVIDEVAGFMVAMSFVPPSTVTVIAGFLLFRALDIIKPWPASAGEKLPGGWGIMADDVICGVIASIALHAGLQLWPTR